MREFFRGWKCKVGVATLVMACAFMAGWVRGAMLVDRIIIPFRESYSSFWASYPRIGSCRGIAWCRYWKDPSERYPNVWTQWESFPTYSEAENIENAKLDAEERTSLKWVNDGCWDWEWYGFFIGAGRYHTFVAVPYWSIVLPLTVLSAWLILSKPPTKSAPVAPHA